jgi:hypothetical protein
MHDPEQDAAIAAATEAAEWDAQGLALTFERIVVAGDAAIASFVVDASRRMIVGLERARDWDALSSTVLGPDHRASQSFRPSEHRTNRWTIFAAGLAPDGVSGASITLAGDQHVVPVIERLYLFAVAVDREPELEPLAVSFVE